jgi:hypothetical protein
MSHIIDLCAVAHALGRQVARRETVLVRGRPLIFSYVGDDWRACRDHVRTKHGLRAWVISSENERSRP